MFIKTCFILLILVFTASGVSPQKKTPASIFVSIHGGMFNTSLSNFEEVYDSRFGLVYGLSLAVPTSSRSYLFAKASYFSKKGVPLLADYIITDGELIPVNERREGTANFKQWIFNLGFLYKFFPHPAWTVGIDGGLTYSTISEDQKYSSGTLSFSVSKTEVIGLFAGFMLERNFTNSHFSIFIEPQYNYAESPLLLYSGNYGGVNINLGVRYYFNNRRVE